MSREHQGRVFNFNTLQDWASIRARYIDAFDGEMPHPKTEATIIEAFEQHPDAVRRELAKLATDKYAGRNITTGWGLAKKRAEQILQPASNPTAKTGIDREKAVARAETWMHTAGMHFDRQSEILLELFGPNGRLHAYAHIDEERLEDGTWQLTDPAGDLNLIDRMVALWNQHRPAGIAIEQEALERAAAWKRQQETHPWNASTSAQPSPQAAHRSSPSASDSSSDGPPSHSHSESPSSSDTSPPPQHREPDPALATTTDDLPL